MVTVKILRHLSIDSNFALFSKINKVMILKNGLLFIESIHNFITLRQ